MGEYVLHLPEDDSVVLSGPVARRLVEGGNGDAALLYIAILRSRGSVDDGRLLAQLQWKRSRFDGAVEALKAQGLIALPNAAGAAAARETDAVPAQPAQRERPDYTREDLTRAMDDGNFAALTAAVEEKLGRKLMSADHMILLGLYHDLGLPADVIYLLVGFCTEKITAQYGAGRRPTLRQIEREGYLWARLGLMDQGAAAEYIRKYQAGRQALPQLMRLLRLPQRQPSPSEEKYLLAWSDMGFAAEVIELAYDRTMLQCKELKWPYMNKILTSWREKGLRTVEEILRGDRPARQDGHAAPAPEREGERARADMARMEKYLKKLRRQNEGER